jgi:hypothetical protein
MAYASVGHHLVLPFKNYQFGAKKTGFSGAFAKGRIITDCP